MKRDDDDWHEHSFPYTDTLKILQKFGPGCYFFGLGEDKDIDDLETKLKEGERILALFCEVPSNPLLKTPDLKRLRQLADDYDFLIVVDETIGNFCNVSVLPYADMVVSSLTKIFSGDCNVMGGRWDTTFCSSSNWYILTHFDWACIAWSLIPIASITLPSSNIWMTSMRILSGVKMPCSWSVTRETLSNDQRLSMRMLKPYATFYPHIH